MIFCIDTESVQLPDAEQSLEPGHSNQKRDDKRRRQGVALSNNLANQVANDSDSAGKPYQPESEDILDVLGEFDRKPAEQEVEKY